MTQTHTPVVFLDPRGNYITNDPVLKAHQTLGRDLADLVGKPLPDFSRSAAKSTADDESIDTDEYDSMNGKQLKAEAKERGVDIKGLKTVGEVREALRAADASTSEPPASDNQSDEDEDDEEE